LPRLCPGEDIIRYNRASKVYDVKVGEYALVTAKNHKENEITVHFEKWTATHLQPATTFRRKRLSRSRARIRRRRPHPIRAPFTEKRVANGELATIAKIGDEEMTVKLDGGREVSFETEKFRHLDHGYAVTSHSSQGTTADRVLINADTSESRVLLNDRMGYVAISRAREDAIHLHELN